MLNNNRYEITKLQFIFKRTLNMLRSIQSVKFFLKILSLKCVLKINLFHTKKKLELWNVKTYENIWLWNLKTIQHLSSLQLNPRRRNVYIKYSKGNPLFRANRQIIEKKGGVKTKIFSVISLFSDINRLVKAFFHFPTAF